MDLTAAYDTTETIESKATPDLIASLLLDYIPQSHSWVSMPDENDPAGESWTPHWSDISEALAAVESFLDSDAAGQMTVDGFPLEELIDELQLFCAELREASEHTSKFYVSVY